MIFLSRTCTVITSLAVFILVTSTSLASAADPINAAAVRVRIHDYANIRPSRLARTQRLVSHLYDAIDVRTEWLEVTRPLDDTTIASPCGPTDLTIILLTAAMAERRQVPPSIAGYAAVTPGEAGRVAFVIYDRVREIAQRADADVVYVMGTVIAHELGHLLLPSGAHSDAGLMRRHWDAADFKRPDLHFSSAQATTIRQTIDAAASLIAEHAERTRPAADSPVDLLATIVD
jgi:hypothetical protein